METGRHIPNIQEIDRSMLIEIDRSIDSSVLRGLFLSSRWIQSSKRILRQIGKLEKKKDKDRLDHIRSMRFILSAS